MVPDLAAIEAFLRSEPTLHVYELGDLDPREAPHTTWLTSRDAAGALDGVALLYRGLAVPTILGLGHGDVAPLHRLLAAHAGELPDMFYAHLTPGLEAALAPRYHPELMGPHHKMALARPIAGAFPDAFPDVRRLTLADGDAAVAFYAEAYPGSYFEPSNLERGIYVATHDAHGLAAVAGTHVFSPALRVASLGNIATRPDARSRGHARRATAALCALLAPAVDLIGLNVRANNTAAIACYRAIGFELRHPYNEWRVRRADV